MPTIFRTRLGWAVRIYPNDHRPPHVHLIAQALGAEARFELLCDNAPMTVRLIDNYRFSHAQLNAAAEELDGNIEALCNAWRGIHG